MSALFAFLHHLAAFVLFAAVFSQLVLLRGELTLERARQVRFADLAGGISFAALLVVGPIRMVFLEKGSAYYSHSLPAMAKMVLFLVAGLLSIYPTVQFLSWRKALARGEMPALPEAKLRVIRRLLHGELLAVVLILLAAALMARGIGTFG
jgi:putative membrane protein